jgi:hypothetical protein
VRGQVGILRAGPVRICSVTCQVERIGEYVGRSWAVGGLGSWWQWAATVTVESKLQPRPSKGARGHLWWADWVVSWFDFWIQVMN